MTGLRPQQIGFPWSMKVPRSGRLGPLPALHPNQPSQTQNRFIIPANLTYTYMYMYIVHIFYAFIKIVQGHEDQGDGRILGLELSKSHNACKARSYKSAVYFGI